MAGTLWGDKLSFLQITDTLPPYICQTLAKSKSKLPKITKATEPALASNFPFGNCHLESLWLTAVRASLLHFNTHASCFSLGLDAIDSVLHVKKHSKMFAKVKSKQICSACSLLINAATCQGGPGVSHDFLCSLWNAGKYKHNSVLDLLQTLMWTLQLGLQTLIKPYEMRTFKINSYISDLFLEIIFGCYDSLFNFMFLLSLFVFQPHGNHHS